LSEIWAHVREGAQDGELDPGREAVANDTNERTGDLDDEGTESLRRGQLDQVAHTQRRRLPLLGAAEHETCRSERTTTVRVRPPSRHDTTRHTRHNSVGTLKEEGKDGIESLGKAEARQRGLALLSQVVPDVRQVQPHIGDEAGLFVLLDGLHEAVERAPGGLLHFDGRVVEQLDQLLERHRDVGPEVHLALGAVGAEQRDGRRTERRRRVVRGPEQLGEEDVHAVLPHAQHHLLAVALG
jgi:hypothetical protein